VADIMFLLLCVCAHGENKARDVGGFVISGGDLRSVRKESVSME